MFSNAATAMSEFVFYRAAHKLESVREYIGAELFDRTVAAFPDLLTQSGFSLAGNAITLADISADPEALRPAGFTGRMP